MEEKEEEEIKVKAKAKKEKQSAGDGFELWNELEVQRIKFMVRSCFKSIISSKNFI